MSNGGTDSERNPAKIPGKDLQFLLGLAFDSQTQCLEQPVVLGDVVCRVTHRPRVALDEFPTLI